MKLNCIQISADKKKLKIGGILGAMSMILLFLVRDVYIGESNRLDGVYLAGVPLFLLFLFVGGIRINISNRAVNFALCILWSGAAAVASMFWAMAAVESIAIWRMPALNICLNIALFFGFVGVIFAVLGNWRWSVNTVLILTFIIAVINSYVWQFRGREILYSDLASTGTAMMVVKEYVPVFSLRMALGVSVWVLVFFSQFSFNDYPVIKQGRSRIVALVVAICMGTAVLNFSGSLTISTWGGTGSGVNGFFINFLLSVRDAKIEKPEGYSQLKIQDIEQDYAGDSLPAENQELPNIIVIMNESFADFRAIGENFHTNEPVMPFWDSLEENTVKGYALASVYGGSTANSEFEFLTGLTMSFLPTGSSVYQQYLPDQMYSLAWLFNSYGYNSWATHPYDKNSWSRASIYPRMGFQSSTFVDDYPKEKLIRNWVSDREMYEYILEKLETDENQPQFVFGITMQNHGGYAYKGEDFRQVIQLVGYEKEYPGTEQYLTLMRESDKAIEYLLTELESCDRDTVVLIFGDHFPAVESDFYNAVYNGSFSTFEEQMLRYKVPFVVWANYDIQEKNVECTSLNYLGCYLLEAANIELPAYWQFLSDLEGVLPSINGMGYYSTAQETFVEHEDAAGEEWEWLNKYQRVQYDLLFAEGSNNSVLFNQYTGK